MRRVIGIFCLKNIHEKGKIFIVFSFFFVFSTSAILAEDSHSDLLLDNRITGNLFIPTLGKTFDSQAFISRTAKFDMYSFDCSISNTHNKIDSVLLVDGESYVCGYRYESNFSKRLRLQGSLNAVSTGGGIFDSSISGWHNFWGFPNGNRTGARNNQYDVQVRKENGESFKFKSEDIGVLDPQIYASYLVNELGQDGSFYLNGGLSLPLQLSQFGSKTPSVQLGVSYGLNTPVSSLAAGTDLTIRTDTSDQGINYSLVTSGLFVGWTRSLSESFAFVSNSYFQSSVIEDVTDMPKGSWYVDLGIRTDIIFSVPFEVLIRENLYSSRGTADVSLILRVIKF